MSRVVFSIVVFLPAAGPARLSRPVIPDNCRKLSGITGLEGWVRSLPACYFGPRLLFFLIGAANYQAGRPLPQSRYDHRFCHTILAIFRSTNRIDESQPSGLGFRYGSRTVIPQTTAFAP